jgi:photosystem II stability/assembly factor-like uncharacterized protein
MRLLWVVLISVFLLVASRASAAAWEKQDAGTLAWLHSVYFLDSENGWIAGSNGTLLTTRDGGLTWIKSVIKKSDTFRDVYFSDSQNGWILCERNVYASGNSSVSYLLATVNGGKNWQAIELPEGKERLIRLLFPKPGTAFAIGEGGILLRMQGDRNSWATVLLPVRYLILDGAFTDAANGLLVGGGGTVLRTTDGGTTWIESKSSHLDLRTKLNAVHFNDSMTGWVAGDEGKIYVTRDGGRVWREQSSSVLANLRDIAFVDSKFGFAVGDSGTIVRTSNGGENWNTEARITKHSIERIAFAGNRGFAVGYGGTVLTTRLDR